VNAFFTCAECGTDWDAPLDYSDEWLQDEDDGFCPTCGAEGCPILG
jgi:DNA-directed RNA polymerase subunit RPC12/RpoP